MTALTYDEIKKIVKDNNRSKILSDEFIICLAWKESGFKSSIKNEKSTATGLMQITRGVIIDVNKNFKTSFAHSEMSEPEKNIQCGTYYLDLRIKWAKKEKAGIEGFGTGKGYADKLYKCEECLKSDSNHWADALYKVHK